MGKCQVKGWKNDFILGGSVENLRRPCMQLLCPHFKEDDNTLESVGRKKGRIVKIFFKSMLCNERI